VSLILFSKNFKANDMIKLRVQSRGLARTDPQAGLDKMD
jgi:hypothetical protein